jgi:hypothetical protein
MGEGIKEFKKGVSEITSDEEEKKTPAETKAD